jgi:hypothetical protein
MTDARFAPPLPQPPRPAVAARSVAEAARAAADAWAPTLSPAVHSRAVSQLHSILRDLGIACQGLAAYRVSDITAGTRAEEFSIHVEAGARWLIGAWECLDSVLAAEGIPASGDPEEPGGMLCRAARNAILAWRQPTGTMADRDETVRQLIASICLIADAISALASYAPRQKTVDLQCADRHLMTAAAALAAAAVQPAEEAPTREGVVPDER